MQRSSAVHSARWCLDTSARLAVAMARSYWLCQEGAPSPERAAAFEDVELMALHNCQLQKHTMTCNLQYSGNVFQDNMHQIPFSKPCHASKPGSVFCSKNTAQTTPLRPLLEGHDSLKMLACTAFVQSPKHQEPADSTSLGTRWKRRELFTPIYYVGRGSLLEQR